MRAVTAKPVRPLLELDPDLGSALSPERSEPCREDLRVSMRALRMGAWEPRWRPAPGHLGFLMLDGVLSREVVAGATVSPELLGAGDVVRPWSVDTASPLLRVQVRWTVLADARLAVLDAAFAVRVGRYPEVAAALTERLEARAQRLATLQAIGRLGRVEERLVALFWHLAERWGRVTPDGVVIPLTLPHRLLGQLIGARRPTVSAALGRLSDAGRLVRREDAAWLLVGEPTLAGEPEAPTTPRRRLLAPTNEHALAARVAEAATLRAEVSASRRTMDEMTTELARLRGENAERTRALRDVCEASLEIVRAAEAMQRRHQVRRVA